MNGSVRQLLSDKYLFSNINVFVGGLHNAADLVNEHRITHAISLRDPASLLPDLGLPPQQHLGFTMVDTNSPVVPRAPTRQQVREILSFAKTLPPDAKLLIHCQAGISRSTACALAVLAQKYGIQDEQWISKALKEHISKDPIPNLLIAGYADEILGMNGRLLRLAHDIGKTSLQLQHGIYIERELPAIK